MPTINHKLIAWIIAIGSVLFLIAAFAPYAKVFGIRSPEKKMEIINRMRAIWNIGQAFFGGGAVLTATGFTIMAFALKHVQGSTGAQIGGIIMILGASLWMWHCIERINTPELFVRGENTPYLFVIYSILTQAGLVLIGLMLNNTELSLWVSRMFIISGVSLFIIMVVMKDMPPFVYYVVTLIFAITLFRI